jgi:citrate lyase beta subunit
MLTKSLSKFFYSIRSPLFIPGHDARKLSKTTKLQADGLPSIFCPDFEDSVPPSMKLKAIEETINHLSILNTIRPVYPRLNSLSSGLFHRDLDSILTSSTINQIKGFIIPKLNSLSEYVTILSALEKKELQFSKELPSQNPPFKLIPWIESTKGLINMREILNFDSKFKRIEAMAFGAEDFTKDFEIERTKNLEEIRIARNLFAITAHAFDVIALDTPFVEFNNDEGLKNDICNVKSLGFKGKFAIHPNQIKTINEQFSPNRKEIDWAIKIKSIFGKAIEEGKGAIEIDGEMVDFPVYNRALRILKRSEE